MPTQALSSPTRLFRTLLPSPIGPLLLLSDGHALTALYTPGHRAWSDAPPDAAGADDDPAPFRAAADQLDAYFSRARTTFDLPLRLIGTPFQQRVWNELQRIPFGETISYATLAQRIDAPRAARAVGAANARNPISVIVPCHRVIGADRALVGYAGGQARKHWLLTHESPHPTPNPTPTPPGCPRRP